MITRVKRSVNRCSACGGDHDHLSVEVLKLDLKLEGDQVTHVGVCPNTNSVLFFLEAKSGS